MSKPTGPQGIAAASQQAQPCPKPAPQNRQLTGLQSPEKDYTPDAIADCRPCGPQSQYWCEFAGTTRLKAMDHRQTTNSVIH